MLDPHIEQIDRNMVMSTRLFMRLMIFLIDCAINDNALSGA